MDSEYTNSTNSTNRNVDLRTNSTATLVPTDSCSSVGSFTGQVNPGFELEPDLVETRNDYAISGNTAQHRVFINAAKPEKESYSDSEDESELDPWKLPDVTIPITPWSELTGCGKVQRVLWGYVGKPILLIGFLYLFICSLDFLSSAFRLLGGKAAGEVFRENQLLSNPIAGLMIGVLATVLVQSSSTSTSIAISMVGANIIDVKTSIPIVMGANIGTSVTNTIVSMGQIANKDEFRRAFAGATVHDMFNWLSVIVLLPLEVATGYLYFLSKLVVESLPLKTNKGANRDLLKTITKPFTNLVIKVDKKVIEKIAKRDPSAIDMRMVKQCCKEGTLSRFNITGNFSYEEKSCEQRCEFLFNFVSDDLSDAVIGGILLLLSLVILCSCLVCIVKILNSLLRGKIAVVIKRFVNAEFPGKLGYFTGYLAILIGAGFTILVQSSSIFTSSLTPLVGIGVVSIERMYPMTLGSNIGTTTTGILAALSQSIADMPNSLQVAFCHLFFNISGILLFYPIPFMRFPINMAKFLGNETAKYRWFAVMYLILMFFMLPGAVFALSIPGWYVMAAVLIPIILIALTVFIIKVIQGKWPQRLPHKLRDWKFLPLCMRSLKPIDDQISKLTVLCTCCKCCRATKEEEIEEDIKQTAIREKTIAMNGKEKRMVLGSNSHQPVNRQSKNVVNGGAKQNMLYEGNSNDMPYTITKRDETFITKL